MTDEHFQPIDITETVRPEEDEGHFHACRGCRDAVQCWCDHPDDDSEVYCEECEE